MEVSLSSQFAAFLGSLVLGALLGVVSDVIRLSRLAAGVTQSTADRRFAENVLPLIGKPLRRKGKKKAFCHLFLFLGDVLFFVLAAVLFRLFVYAVSDGIVRLYLLFGAAVGFAVYDRTVGRLVLGASGYLLFGIRVVFAYLWFFFSFPFRAAGKGILRASRALAFAVRRVVRQRRTRRITRLYLAGMQREAQSGFLRGELILP